MSEALPATSQAEEIEAVFRRVSHLHEGGREVRRAFARAFVPLLAEHAPVLDVGCGDGTLLDVLREAGVAAAGIDLDPVKVGEARAAGHDVRSLDLRALRGLGDRYGAVVASHIIEHIEPRDAIAFMLDVRALLTPGGRFLIVTPNVGHPPVVENFWLDLTHVRPYPGALLLSMFGACGFEPVDFGQVGPMKDTYAIARLP